MLLDSSLPKFVSPRMLATHHTPVRSMTPTCHSLLQLLNHPHSPHGTLRRRPPDPPPNTPDIPNTSNHTSHITNNVRSANKDLVAAFDIPPESTQPRPIRTEFDLWPLPEFRKVGGWLKSQLRVTEYRQRQESPATDTTPSASNSSGSSRSSPSSGASVERVLLVRISGADNYRMGEYR